MRPSPLRHALVAITLCCTLISLSGPAFADVSKALGQIRLSANWGDMSIDEVASEFVRQTGILVVLDPSTRNRRATIRLSGSGLDALKQICLTFDYEWTESKSGAILMSRRFDVEDEIPQFNAPEMLNVATEWIRLMGSIGYRPGRFAAQEIRSLWRGLSDRQRELLQSGKPLTVASLSLNQRRLVRSSIFAQATFNSHLVLTQLEEQLRQFDTGYLELMPLTSMNPFTKVQVEQPQLFLRVNSRSGRPVGPNLYDYPPFIMRSRQ